MKLTNLLLLGINLIYLSLPVKANPIIVAQSTCQGTVNNVVRQIKNKGIPSAQFQVDRGKVNEWNYGNPTNRTDAITLSMGSLYMPQKERYQIENILSSFRLMNSWANEIVKNCGNTAVVSFALNHSGWIIQYAIQEDAKTRERDCIDPDLYDGSGQFNWNERYCT